MKPYKLETLSLRLDVEELKSLGVIDWSFTNDSKAYSWKEYLSWATIHLSSPLKYLQDERREMREDLKSVYPSFQQALVFLFDYRQAKKQMDHFYQTDQSNGLKIASYVFASEGLDYHRSLNDRLVKIGKTLQQEHDDLDFEVVLDTKPVLERDLAYRSGLGWFGKNSMLIHQRFGSYFLIGTLLLNKKIISGRPQRSIDTDHCGNCNACVESCPTLAIDGEKRQLIASKCISTYTIEIFKESPAIDNHREKGEGYIFGCDICQEVCPWNRKTLENIELSVDPIGKEAQEIKDFFLSDHLENIMQRLIGMSNRAFKKIFLQTPLARTGRIGLLKNLKIFK